MKSINGRAYAITIFLVLLCITIFGFLFHQLDSYKLSSGSVTLLSPNGDEVIKLGSKYTIKWGSSGHAPADKVAIELEDDSIHCAPNVTGCWNSFGIGVTSNTGSYTWDTNRKMFGDGGPDTVPVMQGNLKYRIVVKVSDSSGKSVSDMSDNPFSIN